MARSARQALGRGLSALIPIEEESGPQSGAPEMVDVNALSPNPFQPRREFEQSEIDGLAKSIESQGLLQPVIVRKKVGGYEIVSGERRVRAMRQLGWDRIPSVVRSNVTDREMLELALVENVQRENLNEIEQAGAYQRLLQECRLSHEELSGRVGKSRSAITNTLRLLKLPSAVQEMVRQGAISAGHARTLLALDSAGAQRQLAVRIRDEGLSVRQVEEVVRGGRATRRPAGRASRSSVPTKLDPDTARCLDDIQYRFGTAVRLSGSGKRGKVEILFSGAEDLNRILNLLLGKS